MTDQQQATKAELESMLEKFKDNEDLSAPIQITYTLLMAEANIANTQCPPKYIWNGTQCVPDVG